MPWARHGAGHTLDFDQQVAWLATECSKSATAELLRVAWRTVGSIITRYQHDADAGIDRLAGLRRIGIDEISYRKDQKYMTVVVDHDTRHVVWMCDGHGKDRLRTFFDALGAERSHQLTHISADGARWIADVVAERAPNAARAMDPFHVVAWATDALDTERRQAQQSKRVRHGQVGHSQQQHDRSSCRGSHQPHETPHSEHPSPRLRAPHQGSHQGSHQGG